MFFQDMGLPDLLEHIFGYRHSSIRKELNMIKVNSGFCAAQKESFRCDITQSHRLVMNETNIRFILREAAEYFDLRILFLYNLHHPVLPKRASNLEGMRKNFGVRRSI